MPAGYVPLHEFDRDAWVVGATYWPDPDIAVKVDYSIVAQPERGDPGAELVQRRPRMVVLMRRLVQTARCSSSLTSVVVAERRARVARARRAQDARRSSRSPPSASPSRRPRFASKAGTTLEIRLRSDDTAHGFRIVGTDVDVELPKRGRGVATVTFHAEGRPLHVRVLARLRRGPRVHARRDRRDASDWHRTARRLVRDSLAAAAVAVLASAPARCSSRSRARPCRAIRCPASRRSSSRSSGWASTTSSKSRPRRRAGPGVQRHELRRLPQRAGDRRRRHHRRGARRAPRRARASSIALDAIGRDALPPVLGARPRLPADRAGRRHVFARRVPIPLFGAGLVEAIPDETLLALEDPFDRNRDGVSGRAAHRHRPRDRRAPRRPLRLEGAARDAARVRRRRLPQRDGHHQRSLPAGARLRRLGRADARLRSDSRSRRHPRPAHAAGAASTTSRASCGSSRRSARGRSTRRRANGEQVFAAIGCAACHAPALTTGPSANPLFDRRPVPLFSDLLLHDVGTGDGIVAGGRRDRRRSGRRRCGGCASAGRCCTTAPRRRSRTRSGGTPARPSWRGAGSSSSPTPTARRSSRSCDRS